MIYEFSWVDTRMDGQSGICDYTGDGRVNADYDADAIIRARELVAKHHGIPPGSVRITSMKAISHMVKVP